MHKISNDVANITLGWGFVFKNGVCKYLKKIVLSLRAEKSIH